MELLENPSAWWQISTLVFDTPYKLYLYLIQAGRGVVGWDGKALGGGGGYHRNSLCNRLITYSSSGSSFCKRPSCKININNGIIIIINTIFTTTNQIKHVQACVYVASELLQAHMIWLFREGWGWCWYVVGEIFSQVKPVFSLVWIRVNFPLFPRL